MKSKDETLSTFSLIFRMLGVMSTFFNSNFNKIQQVACCARYEFTRGDINCIYHVGEEFSKDLSYYNFISN